MNIDRAVLGLAGGFVVMSVVLGLVWTPWALLFTGFVGLNLMQAAVTGFCPAAVVLRKLGLPAGCAFGKSGEAREQ